MRIADVEISPGFSPFIIAEVSANHCGDFDTAMDLIRAAKEAGASAVKFQAYEPEDLTIDCNRADFVLKDGPWKGRKLYDLYRSAYTPLNWFPPLFAYAKQHGIVCFASVFSKRGVDLMVSLDAPALKIASMEIVDLPLIRYAEATGKPIILSTGMAHSGEIGEAGSLIPPGRRAFLFCTSGYPTPVAESNLWNLRTVAFAHEPFGISDHTVNDIVPIAATALGACIIEKHFTLDNDNGSEDAEFSLDPANFTAMVDAVRDTWQALQPSTPRSEQASRQLRRSLYAVTDIKPGETYTEANVRSIRPAYGLPPKELPNVLGRTAPCYIPRGTPLTAQHL